ncbi:hypothetical protein BU645_09885 [Staphylococcus chromogenes]|uniref:hypothetical protein n=1 Tax=Staphylococcus chromogenes TaxID=46126 RepID=UPI000D1ACB29|nr:hypothetical protein [Staphylococcus chromogenes]PTG88737.1 hypothetical protein BU645_09885 [Staphylococcus chromogenes]
MHTVLALHRNGEKPTITSHDEFEKSKMEQTYQRYKTKRKEKPWLTTVPQSVKPSRAYYDLCDFVGVPREMPKMKVRKILETLLKLPEIPNDRSAVHEYKGQKITTLQLAALTNTSKTTIRKRLNRGWSIEKILKISGVI